MTRRVGYLFLPRDVNTVLASLPHLREVLPAPDEEGTESDAFPSMRKSDRQIFRVVSNDHYAHLKELIHSLDYCVGQGFIPPQLVKTRNRAQFDSLLAEAHVAERFFRKEFVVQGLDETKDGRTVPEFVARKGEMAIAVEVYTPRTAEGLDLFTDELLDVFKNLDLPLDFHFEIRADQLHRFDDSQKLLFLHPQVLAEGLTRDLRDRTIQALLDAIHSQLEKGDDCSSSISLPELNLEVQVSLQSVGSAAGDSPARVGTIHYPPLSGYAPEAMLSALVRGRLSRKVRKGQGPRSGAAPLSGIFVDLTHAGELVRESEFDPEGVRQTLQEELPKDLGGYDVLAITTSTVADGPGRLLFVGAHDIDGHVAAVVRQLFE